MATISNTSPVESIYYAWFATPPEEEPPLGQGWIILSIGPGASAQTPGNSDGTRETIFLYGQDSGGIGAKFWTGRLRAGDAILANPDAEQVNFTRLDIRQDDLDRIVKLLADDDPEVTKITLEQLIQHSAGKDLAGQFAELTAPPADVPRAVLSECQWAIAQTLLDIVCCVFGWYRLGQKIANRNTLATIGRLVEGQEQTFRALVASWSAAETTYAKKVQIIVEVVTKIYRIGQLDSIVRTIIGNLTLMDKVLYGALALAELAATLASEGTLMVGIVAVELVANLAFLALDASRINTVCNEAPPES